MTAIALGSFFCNLSAQGPEVVIPVPSEVVLSKGTYKFEELPKIKVVYSAKGQMVATRSAWWSTMLRSTVLRNCPRIG